MMSRTIRPYIVALLCAVALLTLMSALPVFAQSSSNCGTGKLCNPTQFPTVASFIEAVLRVIVMLALPVISFFIVYAGFLFIRAQGNAGLIQKARENLLYVLLGSALILGAWVLATLIGETVTNLMR